MDENERWLVTDPVVSADRLCGSQLASAEMFPYGAECFTYADAIRVCAEVNLALSILGFNTSQNR